MQDKIDKSEIQRIASLCKIDLNGDEVDRYSTDLSGILDYMKMLEEVDTKGVVPTCSMNELANVVAWDKVVESLTREDVLVGAFNKDLVFIKTKGVFNE